MGREHLLLWKIVVRRLLRGRSQREDGGGGWEENEVEEGRR